MTHLRLPTTRSGAARAAAVAFLLALPLGLASCGSDPAEPRDPLRIATTELPDAVVGEAYAESVLATGADGQYFWSLVAGDLPPGLDFSVSDFHENEGLVSGIPEVEGSSIFWIRVESGDGQRDSVRLTLDVRPPPAPISISTPRLPPALAGALYQVILQTAGGDEGATAEWSVVDGSLPSGLQLDPDGQFGGEPANPDTVTFTVEVTSGGDTAQKTFTLAVVPENTDRYDITPFPVVEVPAGLEDNLAEAIRRWEAALTGNLGPVFLPADWAVPAGWCAGYGSLVLGTSVDDLLMLVNIDSIDGPGTPGEGNILAQAGPCGTRNADNTSIIGILTLDSYDLERFSSEETVTDIIQHEIAHVIGFGTLWDDFGLLEGEDGADPRYVGAEAVAIYQQAMSASDAIPVENQGGEGTRDSHWREEKEPGVDLFGDLLMTGFIEPDGVDMPLSRMTIASFADLGYQVDLNAADITNLFVAPTVDRTGLGPAWTDLGREIVGAGPIVVFHEDGTRSYLPDP